MTSRSDVQSNGVHVLPRVPVLRGRVSFIVERCRARRTLHLGCVDEGLTAARLATGQHLHRQLKDAASELWGMDISADGIRTLEEHGVEQVLHGNIEDANDLSRLPEKTWDLIVVSEVLEHLSNPGLFLDAAHTLFSGETRLLITVPNGLCVTRLGAALRGREVVHPDHNYWFSPATLARLLRQHGYEVEELFGYAFAPTKFSLTAILDRLGSSSPKPAGGSNEQGGMATAEDVPSGRPKLFAVLRAAPDALLTMLLARARPWAVSQGIIVVARSRRVG